MSASLAVEGWMSKVRKRAEMDTMDDEDVRSETNWEGREEKEGRLYYYTAWSKC